MDPQETENLMDTENLTNLSSHLMDNELQALQEELELPEELPTPCRRRRTPAMSVELEDVLRDHLEEEEGVSRYEDPVDYSNPLYRQHWHELEYFQVWPVETKIRRTRDNSNGERRVHFADEEGLELAEVQCVEQFKRISHPEVWFWWAVKDDEEAFQWTCFVYWKEGDCWIVNDEVFHVPQQPAVTRSTTNGSLQRSTTYCPTDQDGSPAVAEQSSDTPVNVQPARSIDLSLQKCLGLHKEAPVQEECSGNAHGSSRAALPRAEVPDSNWCDVVTQRLQSEDPIKRGLGIMFLLSDDITTSDFEHPHVTPKKDDVIMPLALSSYGYKVILQAISVAPCGPRGEQAKILSVLQGNVKELVESSYGCEVLEACIEYAIPSAVFFVASELQGSACAVARMPEKYQLICRLLEHLPSNATQSLVEELLGEIPALCRHARGNHIVQHLLEYGTPAQQHQISTVVAGDLLNLARHRIASHVVEKAVDASDLEASSLVAQAALREQGTLLALACNRQSQFVAQRLLKRTGAEGHAVRCVLFAHLEQLKESKYGSRIAESLSAYLGATAGA
jgi:pumilio RNA-binding family